jgi:uncharacterized protein YecE (DUF72 family)
LRLRGVDDPLRYFCDTAGGLGSKLGPVLFQLPPNFKQDLGRLGDLLVQLPPGLRAAVEFRNATWFADDTYTLLRDYNVALCVADTEEGTTPLVATADFGYVRLRDTYGPADLERWARDLATAGGDWQDAFVFFKHEEQGLGPELAQQFAALTSSAR